MALDAYDGVPRRCKRVRDSDYEMDDTENTRQSWNIATRNHNAHKGDQASFLAKGETLFPEELELLGAIDGAKLVHLQCNAGQDSVGLGKRGAIVTGIDLSDEAIAFATKLARDVGVNASFERHELLSWLHTTSERFDIAFSSYGAVGWLPDLDKWAQGIARVLKPGGRFVYVEFHPLVWSWGEDLRPTKDDYFSREAFLEPVGDYVKASGAALLAEREGTITANTIPAKSWQYTLAEIVDALVRAGLVLECLREYPYANGCKVHGSLVPSEGRRWIWPEGIARTPLMFGLVARR